MRYELSVLRYTINNTITRCFIEPSFLIQHSALWIKEGNIGTFIVIIIIHFFFHFIMCFFLFILSNKVAWNRLLLKRSNSWQNLSWQDTTTIGGKSMPTPAATLHFSTHRHTVLVFFDCMYFLWVKKNFWLDLKLPHEQYFPPFYLAFYPIALPKSRINCYGQEHQISGSD